MVDLCQKDLGGLEIPTEWVLRDVVAILNGKFYAMSCEGS